MPYADYTLDSVETALGLIIRRGELFPGLGTLAVPAWLEETLALGRRSAALVSEKARSEFMVVPILLAASRSFEGDLAIFSGQRLDVEPSRGLIGECDFILALTAPIPRLKAPLVTILEAKKGDIEAGLGQCIAQSVAAYLFNERAGEAVGPIYGCVTTGGEWQFFRYDGSEIVLDSARYYLSEPGEILTVLREILRRGSEARQKPR